MNKKSGFIKFLTIDLFRYVWYNKTNAQICNFFVKFTQSSLHLREIRARAKKENNYENQI